MNNMHVYIIRDELAKTSGPIFEATNDLVARRKFNSGLQELTETEQQDFRLYRIGHIDHKLDILTPEELPQDITEPALEDISLEE